MKGIVYSLVAILLLCSVPAQANFGARELECNDFWKLEGTPEYGTGYGLRFIRMDGPYDLIFWYQTGRDGKRVDYDLRGQLLNLHCRFPKSDGRQPQPGESKSEVFATCREAQGYRADIQKTVTNLGTPEAPLLETEYELLAWAPYGDVLPTWKWNARGCRWH